jgi:DNA-binding NtrC family response regulator
MSDELPFVVVVDSDVDVQLLVSEALASAQVATAKTADQALRLIQRKPPAVLLVGDNLIDSTAEDLVAKARSSAPNVRAILLASGDPDAATRLGAMSSLLTKPLDEERVRVAVSNALRLQRMSSTIDRLRKQSGTFEAVLESKPPPPDRPPPGQKGE